MLVVLIDDVGFGASSAFGGPCQTPTAERLAAEGLKYTRFHCSVRPNTCAAAAAYTVLAGVQAAVAKVTPDVLAGIVVQDATVAVVARWRAAAVLTAGGVLVVTTLLVGWFRLRERFDHFVRWGAGVDLAPRRLTGAGWLTAVVGWVGAAALVLLVSRLLGGDPRQSQTGNLWIPLVSLWCGYWVSLPSLDWVARQPRLSRAVRRA